MIPQYIHTKTDEDLQMNVMGKLSSRQFMRVLGTIALIFGAFFAIFMACLLTAPFTEGLRLGRVFLVVFAISIFVSTFSSWLYFRILFNPEVSMEMGEIVLEKGFYQMAHRDKVVMNFYLLVNDKEIKVDIQTYEDLKDKQLANVFYMLDDAFLGIEYLNEV